MKIKWSGVFVAILLTIAWWLVARFLFGVSSLDRLIVWTILGWIFASIVVLAAMRVSHAVWILAGLVILAALFLPDAVLLEISARLPQPLTDPMTLTYLLTFPVALILGALLLYSAMNLYKEWTIAGAVEGGRSPEQRKHIGIIAAVCVGVCAILIAKTMHTFYWFMVWDSTNDPLGILWLPLPLLVVFFCSAFLFIKLPGRTKLAGFLYLMFIPVLVAVSIRAQSVDFRALTKERAQQVSRALDTYQAREGSYPQDLRQLTPFYLLSLPGPLIMYGQGWCYQGGEDYYRLGYLDRDHWSSPILFGRVYSAQGHSPLKVDVCQPAIDAFRAQHPEWERALQYYGQPTPTPDIRD